MRTKIVLKRSPGFILKKISRSNIEIFNLKQTKLNVCEFEIDSVNVDAINKLFNIKIKKQSNVHKIIVASVMLFVFFILYFFSQNYCFQIKINGADKQLSKEIFQQISQQVGVIKNKNSINTKNVEALVLKNRNITLCSANFVGTCLVINVKQSDIFESQKSNNITSEFDGIVESINVVSGTAQVKKGDIVKKGDVLIAGFTFSNDKKVPINASGQINILAYCQIKEVYSENKEITNATGNKIVKNRFTFFKPKDIIKVESNFKLYSTEVNLSRVCVGNFLPMWKQTVVLHELEKIKVFESFEQNKTFLEKELLEKAKQQAGASKAFYAENVVSTCITKGVYEIVATVQFLEEIG